MRRARDARHRSDRSRATAALAPAVRARRLRRRPCLRPAQLRARRLAGRGLRVEPPQRPRLRVTERERRLAHLHRRLDRARRGDLARPRAPVEPVRRHRPARSATLDPPTFGLDVHFADGSHERLDPPGDKTEVCFTIQLQRFLDHVLQGTPPVPGLTEALASLELAERIAQASGSAPRAAA